MNVSAEVFLERACYVSGTCHVISSGSGGRAGGAEGKRRRGKMEAEKGRPASCCGSALSHLQLSFQSAAPFLFLSSRSVVVSHISNPPTSTLQPPLPPPQRWRRDRAEPALFLARMTRYHMKLLTRALILDLPLARGKRQAGSHQSLARTCTHKTRTHAHTHPRKKYVTRFWLLCNGSL